MSTALRALRSGIAATLICGGLVAFAGLPPRTDILVTEAQAAEGVRSVKSVCEWNDVAWKDMAAAEQAAWTTLGWRPEIWGSDDPSAEPKTSQKEWSELTEREKHAAKMLGYDHTNWNIEPDPCAGKRPLTKPQRRTAALPSRPADLSCPLDALGANCARTNLGERSSAQ
jgi:hypothetical protein